MCIRAIRARFLAPLKDAVLRNDALGIRSQSLRYTSETLKLPSVKDLFCMAVGVRTHDLRKVYNSAPPLGAAGGFIARADAKGGKQPKVQIPALDGLSLEILPGEIFGLLGPNGAGKSTTVGVLTTRVRPTSGQAWIGEHEVWKEQAQVKRLIGVVPQRPNRARCELRVSLS